MGKRSIPAPFLTKTYELVDDVTTNDVVSWGEKGITFVVWKTAEFAMDVLPNYFKHNNFSSFVRQLNTYGFHKIASDKWEFANENFKKGDKSLLIEIRRRKTRKPTGGNQLQESSSGEDVGSSAMSSPVSKNPRSPSMERGDLMGENEKLREDNEKLRKELGKTRKQCDELMKFLSGYLNVELDEVNEIMIRHGKDDDEDEDKEEDKDEGLKVFGVWLKHGTKRGRCCETENNHVGLCGGARKVIKTR